MISTFWGAITLLLVSYVSVFTASSTLNSGGNVDLTRTTPLASQTRLTRTVPDHESVRGLTLNVPELPEGLELTRLTFDGSGSTVAYRVRAATQEEIANFYSKELPKYGWAKLDDAELVFVNRKNLKAVRIASTDVLSDGAIVSYEIASVPQSSIGMVRGQRAEKVSFWSRLLAQADTTQPPPPSDGGTSQPPPPAGNYTQPTQNYYQPPSASEGNYPPPGGTTQPGGYYPQQGGQYPQPGGQYPPTGEQKSGQQYPPSTGNYPPQGNYQEQQFKQGQMNEWSEEQEAQRQEQQLKQMKQHMGGFLGQATRMQKEMASVEKRLKKMCPDMSLPLELKNALTATNDLAGQIKNAETVDGVENAMMAVQDAGTTMHEWGQQIPDLFRLCQGRKQMKNDLKQVESRFKKLQSRVARLKNKDDFTQIVSDAQTVVSELKNESDKANSLATTDQEAAIEAFEGFFEKRNDVEEELQALETVLNMSQGIKTAKQEIKKYESTIKRLSKKYDTTELSEILAQAKEKLAELEAGIRAKEDPETLATMVDELFDFKRAFENTLAELTGQEEFTPQGKTNEKAFNFELNDVFRRPVTREQDPSSADQPTF